MNGQPPKLSSAPTRFTLIGLTVVLVAIMVVLYFFNPSLYHFYPVCQFHRLTGLNCPGCGGTRAVYALLHGDFAEAFHDNALFVAGLVAAVLRGGWFALNRIRGRQNGSFIPPRWLIPMAVLAALFGVLRNLPAFSFLSP
jgi:hypothetical protein